MSETIARPRPEPWVFSSSRRPGSAICASFSSGTPGPSSSTVRVNRSAWRVAETATRDFAHLRALSSRLPSNSVRSPFSEGGRIALQASTIPGKVRSVWQPLHGGNHALERRSQGRPCIAMSGRQAGACKFTVDVKPKRSGLLFNVASRFGSPRATQIAGDRSKDRNRGLEAMGEVACPPPGSH